MCSKTVVQMLDPRSGSGAHCRWAHAGGRLLGLGKALVREMPPTLEALRHGAISEWRATVLVRETACLTCQDRETVDRELAGTAQAAADLGRMGTRAIVAAEISFINTEAARRAGDSTTRTVLGVLAALSVCAPLLAMAGATAAGALTFG